MDYTQHITKSTQREQARKDQVQNNAGGYVFEITALDKLRRFLILGTEGGSYYASERAMTRDNVATLDEVLESGQGRAAVALITAVSSAGRAPKNDPAIFALAYLTVRGDKDVKTAAYAAMTKVCRTGTHLFQWADCMKKLGAGLGGDGAKRAVSRWYLDKDPQRLALQVVKYRQRVNWTHRDILRVSHVRPPQGNSYDAKLYRDILTYAARPDDIEFAADSAEELQLLYVAERLKHARSDAEVVALILDFGAPRELIPTQFLNSPAVWEALLDKMPMTATVRNLGKMTSIGLLGPLSQASKIVVNRLSDAEHVVRSRMHPVQVLAALTTYQSGHGVRGSLTWTPDPRIVDALDGAFYSAFGSIEPSGKRLLLALDVSGSMGWGAVAGVPGLTPAMGAAAMAMVTARTESEYYIMGFASGFRDLGITAHDTLQSALQKTNAGTFGRTDCALPMLWAQRKGIDVDGFVVYTDNETWAGNVHPYHALLDYRRKRVREARSVVVGMTATDFSIAAPDDPGMLDVVGFDTAAPQLIADFTAGNI